MSKASAKILDTVLMTGALLPVIYVSVWGGGYPPADENIRTTRTLVAVAILCCIALLLRGRRVFAGLMLALYVIVVFGALLSR